MITWLATEGVDALSFGLFWGGLGSLAMWADQLYQSPFEIFEIP